jgi:tRNA dimethylallyltransferase
VADALAAIAAVRGRGAVPLLVGGTMLYFNALVRGLARLPSADPQLRAAIDARAARSGWAALHAELQAIDPEAAARIHPNDPQRIQRALEVFELSGRTITAWQRDTRPEHGLRWSRWALVPADRAVLHARIAQRYARMLEAGLLAEVRQLLALPGIHRESPAMRAVGYRQLAAHLSGECSLNEAVDRAVAATRQLAKRQLTWINADPGWQKVDPFQPRAWEAWVATLQTDFQTVPGVGGVVRTTGVNHGQGPVSAGSVPQPAAQGARTGINLSRQWHQAAGSYRFLRPVRRAAEEHGEPDGL